MILNNEATQPSQASSAEIVSSLGSLRVRHAGAMRGCCHGRACLKISPVSAWPMMAVEDVPRFFELLEARPANVHSHTCNGIQRLGYRVMPMAMHFLEQCPMTLCRIANRRQLFVSVARNTSVFAVARTSWSYCTCTVRDCVTIACLVRSPGRANRSLW